MSSGSYIDAARTKQMKDLLGVRHIQAVLLAGALFVNHIQQSNVAITAVAITSHNPNITYWKDGKVRARGSFFYSLIISCLVGGYLTTKFDIKIMLLCSTVVGTITTYLTPTLVKYYNWQILIAIRILHGSSKGFIRPLVYSQLVRWLPPDELMLMGPVVLSSLFLGYGLIEMMGGYLSSGQGGWPSIFYFSGNIGFIWCLAYLGLGSQSPNACFYISVYEKRYIEESLPSAIRLPYRKYIPLKKILTCVPLYALIISQSANNYALQTFVKIVPLFYGNSLQLDVQKIGLAMGLPLFSISLLVYIKYYLLKFMIKRRIVNHSEVRHIFNGIGQFGAFYFFMYCAFTENYYVCFTFHCIGMILSSCQLNGFYMNYFDLSPNFIGVIVGIGVSCAHCFSIAGTYISFSLYSHYYLDPSGPQSILQAKEAIYFFLAMFYFLGGLLWELLGSTKIQPFNDIKETEEPDDDVFNESDIIKT